MERLSVDPDHLSAVTNLNGESSQTLFELLSATCEGICLVNGDGQILGCDHQFEDKIGGKRNDLQDTSLSELGVNGENLYDLARTTWEDGQVSQSVELQLAEGARLPVFVQGQRLEREDQDDVAVLLLKDLLEREMSQITFRRERLLRGAFFDAVAEGLYRFQLDNPLATFWPDDVQVDHLVRETRIKSCNEAAARQLGVNAPQEAEGEPMKTFLGSSAARAIQEFVKADYQLRGERVVVDTPNGRRHFQLNLIGLDQGNQHIEEVWGSALDITTQVQRESKFAQRLEERKQDVARKLHDEVSPYLTGARLMIDKLAAREGGEDLDLLAEYLEKARDYVAHVHNDLRPPAKGESLGRVLEELVDQYNQFSDIDFQFESNTQAEELDQEATTHLFRIAQEALRNALDHSGADQIVVRISEQERHLKLEVSDDGQGFDPNGVVSATGLENMQYRADALGANFLIDSAPSQSTTIRCRLPLP